MELRHINSFLVLAEELHSRAQAFTDSGSSASTAPVFRRTNSATVE